MADNRGGYRKPSMPAPTSGPGALSRRTDGGPAQAAKYIAGLPYGQGQATYDQQTAAPMAGTPNISEISAPVMEMPTPLFAPTTRPTEPVTSGIDLGDGPGSSALGTLPNTEQTIFNILQKIADNDPSGDTELLYRMLEDKGY
jgi:hypothetical protein